MWTNAERNFEPLIKVYAWPKFSSVESRKKNQQTQAWMWLFTSWIDKQTKSLFWNQHCSAHSEVVSGVRPSSRCSKARTTVWHTFNPERKNLLRRCIPRWKVLGYVQWRIAMDKQLSTVRKLLSWLMWKESNQTLWCHKDLRIWKKNKLLMDRFWQRKFFFFRKAIIKHFFHSLCLIFLQHSREKWQLWQFSLVKTHSYCFRENQMKSGGF